MEKIIIIYVIFLLICSHILAFLLGEKKQIEENIKTLEILRKKLEDNYVNYGKEGRKREGR